jgi:hypothetical protein
MKKRIVKTVLPLLAFMLATAFAFATDQKSSEDEAQTGEYIFRNGKCESITRGCNNQSTTLCTYDDYQVYSENNGTSCRNVMYHQQ